MGVFLAKARAAAAQKGLPHVRGGVSSPLTLTVEQARSSPRAWGCFLHGPRARDRLRVFPTCVGVFPQNVSLTVICQGLPHVRGGVSGGDRYAAMRAWVFPTCVGVFLVKQYGRPVFSSLPHVRGGVSSGGMLLDALRLSSPRAWGCFSSLGKSGGRRRVFPTCVGVFPSRGPTAAPTSRLPHVRGGVSPYSPAFSFPGQSSPRAWGCFSLPLCHQSFWLVFPTCVGVFLTSAMSSELLASLPHVRGGVSAPPPCVSAFCQSSPRAWGCFSSGNSEIKGFRVFPTCVGVFLEPKFRRLGDGGLPHVRGGVSPKSAPLSGTATSSPRAWGCFRSMAKTHSVA